METTSTPHDGSRPARPPLVRSLRDRKVAGVAGGLAEHLNVDPLLVRIAFVVSVFAGGLGVLLYLAGWILIPEEGDQDRHLSFLDRARRLPWLAVALFVFGISLLLSQLGGWDNGATFWGLVLIGLGYLLFRDDREPSSVTEEERAPRAASAEAMSPVSMSKAASATPVLPAETIEAPAQRERVREPRERSQLGRYTFAAMLIVVGGAALLDYAGAFTLELGQYPALALTMVGAGLLAGTFWGRSRALIALGLVLAPVAWAGSLVDVPLKGGFGERVHAPITAESVDPEHELIAGSIQLDLTDLEWDTEPIVIDATAAFGQIEVQVPEGVRVELDGSVGAGQIEFFDEDREGYDLELRTIGGDPGGDRTLILDTRVSIGQLSVTESGL
jgi:phage shock protein PspC (stress-responsive transcriptional regulator)